MTKHFEPDDPMEIVGVAPPSLTDEDIAEMTEGLIDEYVKMGWADEDILSLFRDRRYRMPHMIRTKKGERYVREALGRVRARWGAVWRFRDEHAPEATPADGDFVPLETLSRLDRQRRD